MHQKLSENIKEIFDVHFASDLASFLLHLAAEGYNHITTTVVFFFNLLILHIIYTVYYPTSYHYGHQLCYIWTAETLFSIE